LVSPYAVDREGVRRLHEEAGLPFTEVYVNTPPDVCERRDPKGLWRRARRGELPGFTGVDDVYEPPASPDIEIRPDMDKDSAVEAVLAAIKLERS
jgi:bifunctional enzyme CysN/CysC